MERLDDGLEIRADGRPGVLLRRVDLDTWHDAPDSEIAQAAATVAATPLLTIGTAERTPPARLAPLVESLTLTLAGPACDAGDAAVAVPDVEAGFTRLTGSVHARPRAAVALGQLLRQTEALSLGLGLAAEAAVYSMLLGGPEFAVWLARRPALRPATATGGDLVKVTRSGDRLRIELDDPAQRNALSFALREQLYAALEVAAYDDSVTALDLRGAGPAFCSGGHLAEFGTATDLVAAYLVRLDRAPWRLLGQIRERLGPRARAHVQGAAIGAGCEMAAFAGHLSCEPGAYFALPELALGLVPGAGGTVSVTRRIGRHRAAWLMLTGDRLDAPAALAWGLVDSIGPGS